MARRVMDSGESSILAAGGRNQFSNLTAEGHIRPFVL